MTEFRTRFSKEQEIFKKITEQFHLRTVLDAGCGTGFHSLLLASLGVEVTAVDVSLQMLQMVQYNANEMHLQVHTLQSSFQQLHHNITGEFDAVFCLGNSLPHLLTSDELTQSLQNFYSLLKPGGVLFIQLLNYERILSHKERIQNIKEIDGKIYVRFYDFLDSIIRFNILTIEKESLQKTYSLKSIELFPYKFQEIYKQLSLSGFNTIQKFGTLSFGEFNELNTRDLVILARKQ